MGHSSRSGNEKHEILHVLRRTLFRHYVQHHHEAKDTVLHGQSHHSLHWHHIPHRFGFLFAIRFRREGNYTASPPLIIIIPYRQHVQIDDVILLRLFEYYVTFFGWIVTFDYALDGGRWVWPYRSSCHWPCSSFCWPRLFHLPVWLFRSWASSYSSPWSSTRLGEPFALRQVPVDLSHSSGSSTQKERDEWN